MERIFGTIAVLMTLSQKQLSFVSTLRTIQQTSPVSRSVLVHCASLMGKACPPAWIVKDPTRNAGRGYFHVNEVTQLPSAVTFQATIAPTPPIMKTKPVIKKFKGFTPTHLPTPIVGSPSTDPAAAAVLGMTGGDRSTLIPSINPEFVAWGNYKDVEAIIKTGMFSPVFITGLSGNGKTTMIEQVCADLQRECFRVNIVAETDEDDLFGGYRLQNGDMIWQDGPVTCCMKRGGILLLDEIDLGSDKMMCLQSVLEGKGVYLKKTNTWVTPKEGFTIFATANTKGKGSDDGRFVGTRVMNEAMLDRFDFTLEQEYAPKATERKILTRFMKKFGMEDEAFSENLVVWAAMIRKTFAEGACDEIISTRRLLNIIKAYAMFGDKSKAVKMSLSRFDDATQQSFYSSYTKIDAEILPNGSTDAVEVPVPTLSSTCPF